MKKALYRGRSKGGNQRSATASPEVGDSITWVYSKAFEGRNTVVNTCGELKRFLGEKSC